MQILPNLRTLALILGRSNSKIVSDFTTSWPMWKSLQSTTGISTFPHLNKDSKKVKMAFPDTCCSLPPVKSNYVITGRTFKIGATEVYETVDTSPKRVLITAHDIFGTHPNIRQVSDILALAGYRIVIPDFFHGHGMDPKNFDRQKVQAFVAEHGNWKKTVKSDLLAVIEHYKKQNINAFGILGFCWGGRVCIDAATEVREISAAALVHPAMWQTEDAKGIKCPTLLLPTKDEADMLPFWEILKKNLGEDKARHHRFEDMFHGFAGARGNFDDPLNRQRVNEAINLMKEFFDKNLPTISSLNNKGLPGKGKIVAKL